MHWQNRGRKSPEGLGVALWDPFTETDCALLSSLPLIWRHKHTGYLLCEPDSQTALFPSFLKTSFFHQSVLNNMPMRQCPSSLTPSFSPCPCTPTCLPSCKQIHVNASPMCCTWLCLPFMSADPERDMRTCQNLRTDHDNKVEPPRKQQK